MPMIGITDEEPALLMVGNLSEGFKAYGPFPNFDAASAWCDEHCGSSMTTWIMRLRSTDMPYARSVRDDHD